MKPIASPNLNSVNDAVIQTIFNNLNCIRIGKVVTFNATNQTAEIQIMDKRELPTGEFVDYTLLVDCPVFCLSGVSGGVDIPINVGDTGIILFNDRNIDEWWSTGVAQPPKVYRAHDWSDGLFLCGVRSLKNLITGYLTNATRVWYNGNSMVMTDTLTTFNNPIQSAYKSNDGTAGITAIQPIEVGGNVVKNMTIKNGIITGIS